MWCAGNLRDRVIDGNSPDAHERLAVRTKDFAPVFALDFAPLFGSTFWTNDMWERQQGIPLFPRERACLPDSRIYPSTERQCGGSADVRSEALLEEHLEESDGSGGTGTSTSFVAGGVSFSCIEGEVDLPFLPDGSGTPSGQPLRETRGLSAVFTKKRTDRVLSRKLEGAFLGLASVLEERRKASNRYGNLVSGLETGNQHSHGECTYIRDDRHKEGFVLPLLNGEIGGLVSLAGELLVCHLPYTFRLGWYLSSYGCTSHFTDRLAP